MDDVRDAAERLRQLAAGKPQREVYGGDSDTMWRRQELQDRAILADAYLAESDDEPIDEAWLLESHKFNKAGEILGGGHSFLMRGTVIGVFEWWESYYGERMGLRFLPGGGVRIKLSHIKTRGQLRRLLSALGIEGKTDE